MQGVKNHVHVRREDLGTTRFQMALRLLTDHLGIEFEGVRFNLLRDGALLCSVYVDAPAVHMNRHDVIIGINHAQAVHMLLCQQSQAFYALSQWARPVFCVVAGYGEGAIEICRLEDGRLHWVSESLKGQAEAPLPTHHPKH